MYHTSTTCDVRTTHRYHTHTYYNNYTANLIYIWTVGLHSCLIQTTLRKLYTRWKGTWRIGRAPDCLVSHACVPDSSPANPVWGFQRNILVSPLSMWLSDHVIGGLKNNILNIMTAQKLPNSSTQCWVDVAAPSATLAQHQPNIESRATRCALLHEHHYTRPYIAVWHEYIH